MKVAVAPVLLGLLVVGCETALGVAPDGALNPDAPFACVRATRYSDLPSIEENIFVTQCAFGPCHDPQRAMTGPPAEMLALWPGLSHANLVGVPSVQQPSINLVEPFEPDRSYIMIKLGEYDQSLRKKAIMPLGSVTGICIQKRDAIRRWIEAGAPAEELDAAPLDAAGSDAPGVDAASPDAAPIDATPADAA